MKACIRALLISCALLSLTNCEPGPVDISGENPLVGKLCTVQFRRDVLGTTSGALVSPEETKVGGVDTTIQGVLKSTSGEWVVITDKGRDVWIPKSVILAIRF
jgi:hypothetical protein